MNIRTIDRRLKAIEQKFNTPTIKIFMSKDYSCEKEYRSAVKQYKQQHPHDHVITFVDVDSTGKKCYK